MSGAEGGGSGGEATYSRFDANQCMAGACERSVVKCPGDWGLIFLIVDIVLPGIGTVGSAYFDKDLNLDAVLIGIL